MFSGIVEEKAQILGLENHVSGSKLSITSCLDHIDTKIGDSICVSWVCLTVVDKKKSNLNYELSFDLAEETLRRTALGRLKKGDFVNLERSLKIGSRLHGHFVFGHVDCVSSLKSREKESGSESFSFLVTEEIRPYLATKGSISISGTSLTLGEIFNDVFKVYLIPHTLAVTTLGQLQPGDPVNLEVDMLARYVISAVQLSSVQLPLGTP